MFLDGTKIVLIEDVIPSLPRKCGDDHMRLADLDVLGSAYVVRTTTTDFLSITSASVTMKYTYTRL
jgi:hypothetical protein